jgi:asparagine synthase (glutamine-hydrolysing)
MCGIVGFVDSAKASRVEDLLASVDRMTASVIHRGPDDGGSWVDAASGVALGHRRLSILDVSPEGHQPMLSGDGRFVLVFNGEIYNFAVLREALESAGHRFRGHSDTEVLLAGFCHWGLRETLTKSVGMFALALWDKLQRRLYLARDRMGEKPLYYGWHQHVFMFCSELKALCRYPGWLGEIDRNAVTLLMRYGYVPAPYSIYRGIHKLQPGAFLAIDCENLEVGDKPAPREYWSANEWAELGSAQPFSGSDEEAAVALEQVLREAVRLQMVADVPLGAFLSGGIDSSTIVALMQAQSTRPVKTFSVGFHEQGYNEAQYAKTVAAHLGTDHTELYVTADEAMKVIPSLPHLYDEPFADSSQIPTFLVAQLARRHVTVSLSGDGGDELFCGYSRYEGANRGWKAIACMPRFVRTGAGALISSAPSELLNAALQLTTPSLARRRRSRSEWQLVASVLQENTAESFYRGFVSEWLDPSALVRGGVEAPDAFTDEKRRANLPDFWQRIMYLDAISYLPDDILVKVDRAGMSVSLETRMPLLDHRVVEFAWRLPMTFKRRNGKGKWLLRRVLHKYVPRGLVDRPKMGFGLPIDSWLRGPLREWADALLGESRLKTEGYFDAALVRRAWNAHLSGRSDQHSLLWNVLMFQSWLESLHTSGARTIPEAVSA